MSLFAAQVVAQALPVTPRTHKLQATDERISFEKSDAEPLPVIEQNSYKNRLYTGLNGGMTYTNGWLLEFAPCVGYKFNNRFSMGAVANLRYVSSNLHTSNGALYILNSVALGVGGFMRYKLSSEFFVHSELSAINYELPIYTNGIAQYDLSSTRPLVERRFLPSLPVGIGYTSSEALSFNFTLLYDALHSPIQNPTASPWLIRMGFEQRF